MFSRVDPSNRPNRMALLCLTFFAVCLAGTARGQNFNEYATTTPGSGPAGIVAGPDGNLWFTESAVGKIGRITPSGAITEFAVPNSSSSPAGITAGPDGNLWFTDNKIPAIGKVTTSGSITLFNLSSSAGPADITAGPDGNLWFVDNKGNQIGRITTAGTVSTFNIPTAGTPIGITKGSDNNLWFTELSGSKIAKITTGGLVTEFVLPAGTSPAVITSGPDGNLWFTDPLASQVGKITTAGVATMFPVSTGGTPVGIAAGPDGNLWFTDNGGGKIARITPTGTVTAFSIPTSGSGPALITRGPDNAMWFTENSANKIGRITVPTSSTPVLSISKGALSSVASGSALTYTITYGNTGSGAATGVIVSDNVPTGTTFVSATNGGTLNAGAATWNIGTLGAGTTGQTVSFTVTVTATTGSVNNTIFSIQASGVPPIFGSPISTTVTTGGGGGGGLANLTPFKPSAWSDRIVVTKTAGSTTDSAAIQATDALFVDWAVVNNGNAATTARFFSEVYVDGFLRGTWYSDPPLSAPDSQFIYYVYVQGFPIGPLSAGTHTLRIKADSTNVIAESNETDNEYTKTITVFGSTAPCVANATTICSNGGQYQVTVTWQTSTASGAGMAIPLTSDTSAFWFFAPTNYEIMIKVINGCAFNNFYWVFAGGLTNVKVTIRVVDTSTGAVQVYENPLNTPFVAIQATAAFKCP